MDLIKNFLAVCRRYKTAMLLNLIGLSIAFAAFLVIMMQVNYELGFDRHYAASDRLYRMEYGCGDGWSSRFCRPWAEKLIASSPDIDEAGAYTSDGSSFYLPEQGRSSSLDIDNIAISEDLLDVFEFDIAAGSTERFAEPDKVILSQTSARKLFGESDPIGRTVVCGIDRPMEVIAVYRDFPKNSTPLNDAYCNIGDMFLKSTEGFNSRYYVRTRSAGAKDRLESDLSRELEKITGDTTLRIRLSSLQDVYYSSDLSVGVGKRGNKAITISLLSVAVLIVVIAIINFINFSMALVPVRIRSINTRKVFGCRTGLLRMNLLAEGVLIAFVAFCLSLLVVQALSPTPIAAALDSGIGFRGNSGLAGLTLGVALLSGLIAGIYPAFYITSFNPAMVVKGAFGYSAAGKRLRTGLVSFQYVVSIAMIAIALCIHSQNEYMRKYDMGFGKENILTAYISTVAAQSPEVLSDKLKAHPDISDVTLASGPFVADSRMSWGREYKNHNIGFTCYPVASNFIRFMGLKVIEGRDFLESDERKAAGTYIFNRTAQRSFDITVGDKMEGHTDNQADIVGIVQDFNFRPLQYPVSPIALYVFGSEPWNDLIYLMVRVSNPDIRPAVEHIKQAIGTMDPDGKTPDVTFMDENIGGLYKKQTNLSALLTSASLLSVLISIIGVFGLVFFENQYRRKEIGLRKVYGATVGEILRMFNKSYVRLVLICFAAAAPIAYLVMDEWLENFTYRTPIHWWIFAVALGIVLQVTVFTITLQSYRSAMENPVKSFKTE